MRKILISLLLAGAAATPAIAGPHNWSDHQQAKEDRQQSRDDRAQAREERQQSRDDSRGDRSDNRQGANARQFSPQVQQQQAVERSQFNANDRGQRQAEMNAMRDSRRDFNSAQRDERIDQRDQRIEQRQQARDLRQSSRPEPNVVRNPHPLIVSNTPRPGTQPPLRADNYRRGDMHWDRNWQHDGHHDWRRYRDHHRSLFHLGFYYDPFGWGYEPFSIGWRMWPAYYGNRYWIDAGMYGLPYPPPGAAWVRYYNDVMLIDLYTGTVLDVIPGFFW